ncbi:hypothetical protein [Carboxylicivirga taeanensis]|uniref:hypothetical protein n=1 Tax=Carboxylicivirga taeanensis TaxID=1416875 RepID=UPI003F6E2D8A
MKKVFVLALMASMSLSVFTACDKDDDTNVHPLIGTWEYHKVFEDGEHFTRRITFNEGGQGTEYYEELYNGVLDKGTGAFDYKIEGNNMVVTFTKQNGQSVTKEPFTDEVVFHSADKVTFSLEDDGPITYVRKK